ncbi:hypothetical protein HDU93_007767, partial [Gonapodya sp. JEL0774]
MYDAMDDTESSDPDPDPPTRRVRIRRLSGVDLDIDIEADGFAGSDADEYSYDDGGWRTPVDSGELDYVEERARGGIGEGSLETTPLLSASGSRKHSANLTSTATNAASPPSQHGVSTMHAYLLLLKSFIATGILFLPLAFSHGGLLLSLIGMIFFGVIGYHCYLLLFLSGEATRPVGIWGPELRQVDFGDVAERCGRYMGWALRRDEKEEGFGEQGRVWGRWMRRVVVGSIAISQ